MKRNPILIKSGLAALAVLSFPVPRADASIFIQELFDNISSGNATLNAAGSTTTSVGMSGNWATNGSTGIYTANNFDVVGSTLPGLPANGGANGGVWNNTGSYNTGIYATRPLTTPVDFGVDRVIYFSVRLNNPGDTAVGVGLASGATAASEFVGAGFTWNNAIPLGSSSNIAGNSSYISHGILDSTVMSGVYGIRAFEGQNSVNTYGLLVGRITISAAGDDVIHIKRYAQNATIDNDLSAIIWSTTSSVNTSMVATRLLLWINGQGGAELDSIRFGDTWTDVTGVTLAGAGQPALSGANVTNINGTGALGNVNLFTSAADVTLHWDTADQGTGSWASSNALGNKPVGPVSGAFSGLSPDTLYFYRFHAVNTFPNPDLEAWSEEGTSFATSPAGLAVADLTSVSNSPFEVELLWSDAFNTETGYIIQRSPAGAGSWVTVGTVPADNTLFIDRHSGLVASTSYDYRVIGTNGAGDSDPSNISNVTTGEGAALETKLLVNFDGQLDGTTYTLGEGEVDVTNSFQAHGFPNVSGGVATLNPGNDNGPDGFDINPSGLGNLTTQNWVAEALVTYQSTGTGTTPVVIDVQGDCNVRLRDEANDNVLLMVYWNGSSVQKQVVTLPPNGVKVHIAYAWNASSATLTGYINGVSFGSVSGGAFATPDPSNLSFGYFGRTGYEGRGIDGVLDAVAFQTGTAPFDPGSDFLILPGGDNYASWISGFPVGGLSGFGDDADGDGLKNGVEAFLGTNPSVANGGVVSQISTNGTVTSFTHPQAATVPSDVTGSYEWSQNLVTWYAGDGVAGPVGGPTINIPTVTPAGGTASVTATSSAPVGKLFIRIASRR